jgi:hypothetical protein
MKNRFAVGLIVLAGISALKASSWPAALAAMPLPPSTAWLTRTNCTEIVLRSFRANPEVKALIFMPGATDELFFFKRVQAVVTNVHPTVLDAVEALTNQSPLRATFCAPFLLIHSDEDVLDLDAKVLHLPSARKLETAAHIPRCCYLDRDWDFLLFDLRGRFPVKLLPAYHSPDSWHFYRHTFAAFDLSPQQALEAIALAGKTRYTIRKGLVEFEPDPRIGKLPRLDSFPH